MRNVLRSSRLRLAVLGLFCALGLVSAGAVRAQADAEPAPIYTDIIIPASGPTSLDARAEYFTEGKVRDLADYLGFVYSFLISIAGLVASVMVIVGGFQYLTSAGDASKIGAAKTRMTNALMGLVLVLGAYTILKTINPALVVLKVPGAVDVSSETISLPWCDELTSVTVNPIWGEPGKCGSVAEYLQGKSRLVCLYRSACPKDDDRDLPGVLKDSKYDGAMVATCVQTLTTNVYTNEPFTGDDVLFWIYRDKVMEEYKAKKGPIPDFPDTPAGDAEWAEFKKNNLVPLYPPAGSVRSASDLSGAVKSFADCKSCIEYGAAQRDPSTPRDPNSKAREAKPSLCAYWQNEANGGVAFDSSAWENRKAAGQPMLSYCRWMADEGGCAQTDFECHEPISENGCGAYDNIKPFFLFTIWRGGYVWWTYGSGKNGTLSARPDALADVCYANPCGYNLPKGCTGAGGFVNGVRTAAAVVRDGISGIQECENK